MSSKTLIERIAAAIGDAGITLRAISVYPPDTEDPEDLGLTSVNLTVKDEPPYDGPWIIAGGPEEPGPKRSPLEKITDALKAAEVPAYVWSIPPLPGFLVSLAKTAGEPQTPADGSAAREG